MPKYHATIQKEITITYQAFVEVEAESEDDAEDVIYGSEWGNDVWEQVDHNDSGDVEITNLWEAGEEGKEA